MHDGELSREESIANERTSTTVNEAEEEDPPSLPTTIIYRIYNKRTYIYDGE